MKQPITVLLNGDDLEALQRHFCPGFKNPRILRKPVNWHIDQILRKLHRAMLDEQLAIRGYKLSGMFLYFFRLTAISPTELIFTHRDGRLMRLPRP